MREVKSPVQHNIGLQCRSVAHISASRISRFFEGKEKASQLFLEMSSQTSTYPGKALTERGNVHWPQLKAETRF